MKKYIVDVSVPATSANLGPGFDCIGVALGLRNRVVFYPTPAGLLITVQGEGAGTIPTTGENQVALAASSLFRLAAEAGRHGQDEARLLQSLPFHIQQTNCVPVMSGLGSSATAVVSGLLAANAYVDAPFAPEELLAMAAELEGHPDNVAPALMGGVRVAVDLRPVLTHPVVTSISRVALVTPQFRFPTALAREVLPQQVPFKDAVFNVGRMGLLVLAFQEGDHALLQRCMRDTLHQPYRLSRIPGAEAAVAGAMAQGAAVALSGAGPSLIAFAESDLRPAIDAMRHAFAGAGVESRGWLLDIDQHGSKLQISPA